MPRGMPCSRQLWGTGIRAPIFKFTYIAAKSLTATLCGCLSKHILYSARADVVVQTRLHEPSVYYFVSFYARQKVSCSFIPSLAADPGIINATVETNVKPCTLSTRLFKAKFHYASWFGAGSKLVRSQVPLRYLVRTSFEPATNQLRTSFKPASNQIA